MKRLILAGALLVCALPAHGQAVVQDGQDFRGILSGQAIIGIRRADSTAWLIAADSLGGMGTSRSYYTHEDIFSTASSGLAEFGADSSSVLDTRFWNRGKLLLYVIPSQPTDNTAPIDTLVRLAIQIRTHTIPSADSLHTFVEQFLPNWSASAYGPAAGDSIAFGHYVVGDKNEHWSGEMVVVANWRNTVYGATTFGAPRGISINLPPLGPYTSIRVRYLHKVGGSDNIKVKGHLLCIGD